ncbi:hypothetical protein [Microvirga roseola]|uniref:hypothetical protein n=1 Tax=Microvirga roseola TaxID=2883126 RepID=UPI001E582A60|nr:hypothetical protein [Microvirga roseola]
MAERKGKHLFATSRIELIKERIQDLQRQAKAAGTNPTIHAIHGETGDRSSGPVLAQIEDAASLHQHEEHVVVFITHEGMMGADLDGFTGWHIYIDENPAAVCSNVFRVPATATYLEAAYDLNPLKGTKWSRLILKSEAPNPADIINDEFLSKLATFDKRARSTQGVYVDIDDWSKVKGSARPLKWWSAWTPAELAAFESVTIAGAGYFHSLGYKATQAWFSDKVTFEAEEVVAPERACPRVLIHYFTRHQGSTNFWKTDKGLSCLLHVLDYLKQVPDLGYWATNTAISPYFVGARLSGEMVSPRQEGTNTLMHHTSCALIYSAKAVPADGPSLEVFGLKKEDVERARQIEDIIQFTLRGALRKPDFSGECRVYLYDQHQAEALASYLEQEGIAMAELIAVEEAGIMDEVREKPGRKRVELDESSKAERKKRRLEADKARKARDRAADREAKRKAGTLRPRGRPKAKKSLSRQARAYRESTRYGLSPQAKKNRYEWKEDLYAIREREAAEARRKKT